MLISQTKKEKKVKKENLFDEIDVEFIDDDFIDVDKWKITYNAEFMVSFLRDYEGFFYSLGGFKEISESDRDNEMSFNSLEDVEDIIPHAIEYYEDITHIRLDRRIEFYNSDGEIVMTIRIGSKKVDLKMKEIIEKNT